MVSDREDGVIPQRGLLLVRPIETNETLPGGRILLTANTRDALAAHQCEVLAVGEPAECDPTRSRMERKCERTHEYTDDFCRCTSDVAVLACKTPCPRRIHPCPVAAGDWILIRPRSALDSPHPERKQWFIHQDAVLAVFRIKENDV